MRHSDGDVDGRKYCMSRDSKRQELGCSVLFTEILKVSDWFEKRHCPGMKRLSSDKFSFPVKRQEVKKSFELS
jgi:hypothetical protein